MTFLEVRCASVDWLASAPHTSELIGQHLSDGLPALIVLSEAGVAPGTVIDALLKQIVESARAPVVVMLTCLPGEHDNALDAIVRTLGIDSVDVPTDTLAA